MKTILTTTSAAPVVVFSVAGVQGPRGATGPSSTLFTKVASETISGHVAVRTVGQGTVGVCDGSSPGFPCFMGITTGAAVSGEPVLVQTEGLMEEVSWSWIPDLPVFVGANGRLTQSTEGLAFLLAVGFAISPTALWIHPYTPIFLEAP